MVLQGVGGVGEKWVRITWRKGSSPLATHFKKLRRIISEDQGKGSHGPMSHKQNLEILSTWNLFPGNQI